MKLNLFFYTHTYEYIKQVMRTQTWCDRARPCAGTSRGSILPLHFFVLSKLFSVRVICTPAENELLKKNTHSLQETY